MNRETPIRSAAVLGAGVMGAAIAAHIANAGLPCLLLDRRGGSREGGSDPNGLARAGLERARKSRPASFFTPRIAARIRVGNFEDDLPALKTVDWIVEAVVEDLGIKRALYEAIGAHVAPHAVISSNTSGLSAAGLSGCLPEGLRSRFLVTHFFNPPRYLHLLELVSAPETDPGVYARMAAFGEDVLGKGIVHAKDTPNFIANRIGTFALLHAVHVMVERGYTIAEVDALTGKAIGRPKSATFRTADLVGLDTLLHVSKNMYESLPDDPARDLFRPPDFVRAMYERGWLGEKTGQGFYRKTGSGGRAQIEALDPRTLEYSSEQKASLPSLEMVRSTEDPGERLRILLAAEDRAGEFLWDNLSATLLYAAGRVPEISDDIVNVDRALRWGFGWELGPFEIWDAIGVESSCARMAADGKALPPLVQRALASTGNFYARQAGRPVHFDLGTDGWTPVPASPRALRLVDRKAAPGAVVWSSPDATLVDLGDDVVCLEFHTKLNTIGPGLIEAMERSLDRVEAEWRGLVLANEGEHFSAGANLLLMLGEIDDDNYDAVERMVKRFQDLTQRIRYSARPVVVAPHGLCLGGGCEVVLAANRVCADAETYLGLVELGAGLIPAGGGCKEWVRRIHLAVPEGVDADLFPYVRRAFETIGMAKVSTSGLEARELGYLDRDDVVVMNRDHRIHRAKEQVLALDQAGYAPGAPLDDIRVVGASGLAVLRSGLHNMRAGRFLSEYDQILGDRLAQVLCGGEVSPSARVSEQYLLDLEREAFLELCHDPRTIARMEHILKTGKPLRN